jgi:pantoate--beta-alanine ligase
MNIFNNKESLMTFLKEKTAVENSIGFVPTMGALHQGHLSLMQYSLDNNKITVVSIFVNPTQFNNPEDLAKYPRTLEQDIEKITALNPEIILYAPTIQDIYEDQITSDHFDYDGIENQMEGKFRPGHFDGVGTIVKRLFEIVNPTRAYFGEKDFQQLQIIKKLVQKNNLKVNIIGCPIYRESNQLAMSSRNERLTPQEREDASILYETLKAARELFTSNSAETVTQWVESVFKNNTTFTLEYFEIADEETLLTCQDKIKDRKYRAFIAVFANTIRLIDTITLN